MSGRERTMDPIKRLSFDLLSPEQAPDIRSITSMGDTLRDRLRSMDETGFDDLEITLAVYDIMRDWALEMAKELHKRDNPPISKPVSKWSVLNPLWPKEKK